MFDLFPAKFIERCIGQYTKDHGIAPKVLCANKEDYFDWLLTGSITNQFNLSIISVDYLRRGEIDLAAGINENKML